MNICKLSFRFWFQALFFTFGLTIYPLHVQSAELAASAEPPLTVGAALMNQIQQTTSVELALKEGRAALEDGRYELANAWLNKSVKLSPKNAECYLLRGRARLMNRLENFAAEDFEEAIRLAPNYTEALRFRGSLQLSLQEYAKTYKNANEAIRLDPSFAMAYNTRAWARFHLGETNAAEEDVTIALKLSPELEVPHKSLRSILERNGRAWKEMEVYTNLAILNPAGAVIYYSMAAGRYDSAEDWSRAAEMMTLAIQSSSTNSILYSKRGYFLGKMGKTQESMADFDKALELNPKTELAYNNRGYFALVRGETDKAVGDFVQAIIIDPHYEMAYRNIIVSYINGRRKPDAFLGAYDLAAKANTNAADVFYFHAGERFLAMKLYDDAIAQFSKAIVQNPKYASAFNERGRCYLLLKKYDEALKDFDAALKLDPAFPAAHLHRGSILALKQKQAEAVLEFKLSMRSNPRYSLAHTHLHTIRKRGVDRALLINDYTELINIHPEGSSKYYWERGKAQLELKHYPEAIADFTAALDREPLMHDCRLDRSRARRLSGDMEGGLIDAKFVLAEQPSFGTAFYEMGLNLQLLNRPKEAMAMMTSAVEANPETAFFRSARGLLHVEQGNLELALSDINSAITLNPEDSFYYFYRGKLLLNRGDGLAAAADGREYLKRQGWRAPYSPYAVLQANLGYREAGREAEAIKLLSEAKAKLDEVGWPNIIIRYLRGEIREEVVMARALDNKTLFTAHLYLGLEQAKTGRRAEGLKHLEWVKDHPQKDYDLESKYALQTMAKMASNSAPDVETKPPASQPSLRPNLDRGLAVYLPLAEDVLDHSSNKLPVKINGEIVIKDRAAFFKGGDNFLDLPEIELGFKPWAVSLWVRFTGTNGMYGLLEQKDSDNPNHYLHLMLRGKSQPQLGFYQNDVISPTTLEMRDSWHHLVFQFTGLHQQIWVDGALICERLSEPYEGLVGITRIGRAPKWKGIVSKNLEGYLKELRIYQRDLVYAEIKTLSVDPSKSGSLVAVKDKDGAVGVVVSPSNKGSAAKAAQDLNFLANLTPPRPFLSINGPSLVISSPPVQVYDLQATSNLNKEWEHLANLTNTTGQVEFIDPGASRSNNRFYRVVVTSSTIVGDPQ